MSRFTNDWLLGGVGVGLATASASFAAYMIATAPAQVVGFGSKEFRVFAAYDRRPGARGAGHGPTAMANATVPAAKPPGAPAPATPAPPAGGAALAALASGIDPTPTGSVPTGSAQAGSGTGGPSGASVAARSPDGVTAPGIARAGALAEFRVRDVVRGQAIIEHRGNLSLVTPGTVLAGAGQVISIERRAEGWVVTTTSGTITGT